jgi:hypothetical protein
MPGLLLVLIAVVVSVGIWIISASADRRRIADYIEQRGGRVVSIAWAPFGKGWFAEKNDRIYEVVYYDSEGNQHFASAKTSMWSGVYWTEDRITYPKSKWVESLSPGNQPGRPMISQIPQTMPPPALGAEGEELRRLREENAQLRERLGIANVQPAMATSRGGGVSSDGMPGRVVEEAGKCPACGGNISEADTRCAHCQIALR